MSDREDELIKVVRFGMLIICVILVICFSLTWFSISSVRQSIEDINADCLDKQ